MSDGFSLTDAFSDGPPQPANQTQNWPNNPGPYPGAPAYPAYPAFPAPGQPFPCPPGGGQQIPGYPGSGPPNPGASPGAPNPGQPFNIFPGPGQMFPGFGPVPTGPTAPQQPGAPSGPAPQPAAQTGPLTVPFELPLQRGMMPRLLITVQGAVKPNPRRFTFDFKRNQDIAFHFNVRFDEKPKAIVRNSMVKDRWGAEERQCPKFPFEAQKQFQIQILVEGDCFKVAVNGEHMVQFNHRVKELNEITAVSIHGDLTLNSVLPSMI